MRDAVRDQTIRDFGEQWSRFTDNEGYYGSAEVLDDLFGMLVDLEDLRGSRVGDIGAGTGRFVRLFLSRGAAHVVAVEPSVAMSVLMRNTASYKERMTYVHGAGESVPADADLDFVFSIGVLHHIPDPTPVIDAVYQALRPGGKMLIWLYGREGNGLYLALATPLRALVRSGPHSLLNALTWALYVPVSFYIQLCRVFRLPMHVYATEVLGRLTPDKVRLVIYDQLNPAYSKYYRQSEAVGLLQRAGFENVTAHHRHRYSWSVRGDKPR